ncbi:MAG: zinc-dependent alcohol dehydrogenase [Saprospiraceae bacterium]
MKALCWNGVRDLRVENVNDPSILNPQDAIIRVTLSSVCGSDLHIVNGFIPTMQAGDILGHEFVGEVVETGPGVQKLKKGDRVVVGSVIGCGECHYCQHDEWSLCDNSNHKGYMQEPLFGYPTAAIFGYTHMFGGYAGSHAEYIRVPYADKGAFVIPEGLSYEQVLFTSDAFPTGFMAADMAVQPGDVVAVWGCGGVGQMAMKSAWLKGASRVIGIDRFEFRLNMAKQYQNVETLNYEAVNVLEELKEMTGGRGPDVCIDAVGLEARASSNLEQAYDKVKQNLRLQTDRPSVLRQAIIACKKGGTLSVVGVYAGVIDKFPMGVLMNKALTVKTGQMHAQRYIPRLLEYVRNGEADPSYLLTHRWSLEQGPQGYEMFNNKTDDCVRVAFAPHG